MNLNKIPFSFSALIPTLISMFCLGQQPRLSYGLEFKGNYRDSEQTKFPIPFPFPPVFLPVGETQGSLETVNAGNHLEVSRISLLLEGRMKPWLTGRIKVDTIDKYDRNPTSTDTKVDVDEAWLLFGRELLPSEPGQGYRLYMKLGKFGKFERQDDRNLESYGVLSTAYNRFEDAGMELGLDMGDHFYFKASYTTGNPVFFRDPNALAGDNGTEERDPFINPNPDPELKSGFVLFYDAEIEDLDFGDHAEVGFAMGLRMADSFGTRVANLMVYGYDRSLREEANLTGSFYNGDLDLLRGVEELGLVGGLPISGDEKEERGANFWLYLQSITFFGQYVSSKIAGLESSGFEGEFAWSFELPLVWAAGGKQLFSLITPAVRYSELDHDFTGDGTIYPTPSVWWPWKKLDLGLNLLIYQDLMFSIEYNSVEFFRSGRWEHNDELLATLSWKWMKQKN